MRNKRETDISNYTDKTTDPPRLPTRKPESGAKRVFKTLGKVLLTVFCVCFIAGVITLVSLGIYIYHLTSEPTGIDLKAKSLNQTSHIFVQRQQNRRSSPSVKNCTTLKTVFGSTTLTFLSI